MRRLLVLTLVVLGCVGPILAQTLSSQDRDRALIMVKAARDDIRKNYYDPNLRGIDLEARSKAAEEKIKQAKSNAEVFGIIAQMFLDFNDSHTMFYPPERTSRVEYGWQMQTFGDETYVIAVKPKSDAESQGIKPGDKVLKIDGIAPTRSNLWVYYYIYNHLSPRPVVRMELQSPGGEPRTLEVKAKVRERKKVFDLTDTIDRNAYWRELEDEDRLMKHETVNFGDVCIWRMPIFDLSQDGVDDAVNKAKKCKTLILDLRRNQGGAVETLKDLVGNFFDRDVTIGTTKYRKEEKPLVGKTRGDSGFKNNLIVLVDSESASAAEVFARIVQLEKRGTVIGDRTSGKVMVSRFYPHQIGLETRVFYTVSVTNADLLMSDGKSLEGSGVTPDQVSLPSAEDLRAGKDMVLARAVAAAGGTIDPVAAGNFTKFRWKP